MSRYTIICVDDEKIITDSLRTQMEAFLGEKFNIETCESGEEALELLEELEAEGEEVPLVISDYMMPRLKGDEFLARVHEKNQNIFTILLTGQATLQGVTSAINSAKLYRYINKPWIREDVELAVNEALESYKKDRKIESQNRELQLWTNKFIETMGTTLDKRDTTTAGHSARLAEYAVKLARTINDTTDGKYKELVFSEEEIQELYFAALLHDIGKIGVRENILLKQERLSIERQSAIQYRFNWIKAVLKLKNIKSNLEKQEEHLLENIEKHLDFVLLISRREYITDDEGERIKSIAAISFIDIDGKEKKLLDNFEVENLLIKRGNLTEEERKIINSHAEHTYNILKDLPWPQNLERVPFIAANHHERLNGTGYYQSLKGEEIPVQVRILAMLDIYEALTASDRPYKPAKSHEEAVKILQFEVSAGGLDKDIFEIFLKMFIASSSGG